MGLRIEEIIAANAGHDKIAEEVCNDIVEMHGYGQSLVKMGAAFVMAGQESGSEELNDLGENLVYLGERFGAGLSKIASEMYDANADFADMACDLFKCAQVMEAIYNETGNEVIREFTKTAADICDIITEDVGGDYIAAMWQEKEKVAGSTMARLVDKIEEEAQVKHRFKDSEAKRVGKKGMMIGASVPAAITGLSAAALAAHPAGRQFMKDVMVANGGTKQVLKNVGINLGTASLLGAAVGGGVGSSIGKIKDRKRRRAESE